METLEHAQSPLNKSSEEPPTKKAKRGGRKALSKEEKEANAQQRKLDKNAWSDNAKFRRAAAKYGYNTAEELVQFFDKVGKKMDEWEEAIERNETLSIKYEFFVGAKDSEEARLQSRIDRVQELMEEYHRKQDEHEKECEKYWAEEADIMKEQVQSEVKKQVDIQRAVCFEHLQQLIKATVASDATEDWKGKYQQLHAEHTELEQKHAKLEEKMEPKKKEIAQLKRKLNSCCKCGLTPKVL